MATATHHEDRAFQERANANQAHLTAKLKPAYDFIVCGAGASGSVVAARLAENPDVQVLLVEAGGSDELEAVLDPGLWPTNLTSDRVWDFQASPNPHLNGRSLAMPMGKVLGGGSSVNVTLWARGHRSDWDHFASEAGDSDSEYANVLDIYRRIENWQGTPDPAYRGTDGPVWVQPSPDPSPVAQAMLSAASELGIPTFDSANGRMMEGAGAPR
ncbi:GMC family oxidoreductase N-terminal domain-containing protein [Sphingomonas sp. 22R3R2A-7]|uniref:GMC family oxidoreductase N-terminal domain-containing protein n=1 Tax=Sphingomonas sp. 22R3R2A-7 TaxID=3050230 RepID=UPI002FDFA982